MAGLANLNLRACQRLLAYLFGVEYADQDVHVDNGIYAVIVALGMPLLAVTAALYVLTSQIHLQLAVFLICHAEQVLFNSFASKHDHLFSSSNRLATDQDRAGSALMCAIVA